MADENHVGLRRDLVGGLEEPEPALVRPYVPDLTPTPVGPFLERLRHPVASYTRPKVVLVAWGETPANAAAALVRGGRFAEDFRYAVRESVASFCPVVREALLFAEATAGFVRREVRYGAAWWLLRHDRLTREKLAAALRAHARMDSAIEEEYRAAFAREYGYPPETVNAGWARATSAPYPFDGPPTVEDHKTGFLPLGRHRRVAGTRHGHGGGA